MTATSQNPVFDYRALRLLMGIIAFSLAPLVTIIAMKLLPSVSASYYTNAQDVFVGLLFIVGAFLWAYNGHTLPQTITSKIASIAALLVALFPTACETCETDPAAIVHTVSAVLLFSILAFFCLGPFRKKTKGQPGKPGRRSKIYLVCGIVMVAVMVIGVVAVLVLDRETVDKIAVIYWVEAIALTAFGVAWITAGKALPFLVDERERLHLFGS